MKTIQKREKTLSGHLIFWPFAIGGLLGSIVGWKIGIPLFLFGFGVLYYNEWIRRHGD